MSSAHDDIFRHWQPDGNTGNNPNPRFVAHIPNASRGSPDGPEVTLQPNVPPSVAQALMTRTLQPPVSVRSPEENKPRPTLQIHNADTRATVQLPHLEPDAGSPVIVGLQKELREMRQEMRDLRRESRFQQQELSTFYREIMTDVKEGFASLRQDLDNLREQTMSHLQDLPEMKNQEESPELSPRFLAPRSTVKPQGEDIRDCRNDIWIVREEVRGLRAHMQTEFLAVKEAIQGAQRESRALAESYQKSLKGVKRNETQTSRMGENSVEAAPRKRRRITIGDLDIYVEA